MTTPEDTRVAKLEAELAAARQRAEELEQESARAVDVVYGDAVAKDSLHEQLDAAIKRAEAAETLVAAFCDGVRLLQVEGVECLGKPDRCDKLAPCALCTLVEARADPARAAADYEARIRERAIVEFTGGLTLHEFTARMKERVAAEARARAIDVDPVRVAQMFHEAYERLAPSHGYKTREASARPWSDVPDNNRQLMTATVREVFRALATTPPVDHDAALQAGRWAVRQQRRIDGKSLDRYNVVRFAPDEPRHPKGHGPFEHHGLDGFPKEEAEAIAAKLNATPPERKP